ncbi:MAG: hypothetical protein NTW14_13135, partial [bacterium]|nr:hypothetical protein [bacterium]
KPYSPLNDRIMVVTLPVTPCNHNLRVAAAAHTKHSTSFAGSLGKDMQMPSSDELPTWYVKEAL